MEKKPFVREDRKPWEGTWTKQKLDAFESYVTASLMDNKFTKESLQNFIYF